MRVVVDIDQGKKAAFIKHLKGFGHARVVKDDEELPKPSEAFLRLSEALEEVAAHQRGEIKLQSARDFLNEL